MADSHWLFASISENSVSDSVSKSVQNAPATGRGHAPASSGPPAALQGLIPFAVAGVLALTAFRYSRAKPTAAPSPSPVPPPVPPPAPVVRRPSPVPRPVAPGTTKWNQGRCLGGGSFGEVFLGRHSLTGQYAAIKVMKRVEDEQECEKEYGLLKGLRHPFVVAIYGVERSRASSVASPVTDRGSMADLGATGSLSSDASSSDSRIRLIMEYCPNGTLSDLLRRDGRCGEPLLRSYARQMLLGLKFLHSHNILHRDIKPANILIDSQGYLKLTDFGMSRHMDSMHSHTALAGSPAYMSPEAIEGRYFVGTDLWAVGATLSQLATGQSPWSHVRDRDLRNANALMHYIAVGPASLSSPEHVRRAALAKGHHPVVPEWLSPEGRDFMHRLLRPQHQDRGTTEELLRHPWITNGGAVPVTESTCFQHVGDSGSDADDADGAAAAASPGSAPRAGSIQVRDGGATGSPMTHRGRALFMSGAASDDANEEGSRSAAAAAAAPDVEVSASTAAGASTAPSRSTATTGGTGTTTTGPSAASGA